MKKLIKIIAGIFAVLAVLSVALEFSLDAIVPKAFNAAAPGVLGVPAALDAADLSLVRGHAALRGLHVGNPEGYKTDGLLDLGSVSVTLDNSTLLSDTIIIKEIAVADLVLTYERGLLNSNLGALIDLLSAGEDRAEETAAEEEKAGKKVIIEKVVVSGIRMNVSVTGAAALTGGGAIPIPLPTITLTDLGKEKDGVTFVEAVGNILKAIAGAAGSAIAGAGNLLGQGVGAVGDGAWAVGAGAVNLVTGGDAKPDESAGAGQANAPAETNAGSKTAAEALGNLFGK